MRKIEEQNVRKLTRIGRQSIGLTLPIEIIRKLGWRETQKVKVKYDRGRIIISDWKE